VQVFIDDCRARGNRPRSIAKYVQDLYAIAPVVQPGSELDWLRRTRNALLRQAHHAPKRKWAEAPVDPSALWAIGCELVERAERQPRDRRRNAARFRDGLVFMVLSSAPVRLENLTAIRIGVHLVLPADTPGDLAFVRTKAGHGSRHVIWPELRAVIDRYLAVYRPVLAAGADVDHLWLGLNGGRPLTAAAIARRIDRITRARLGRPVNPHAFRDAVATAILLERPDCAEAASALLQHRSPDSIAEYTEQGRTVGAARVLAAASVATRARAARESRSR
jgi:integrase